MCARVVAGKKDYRGVEDQLPRGFHLPKKHVQLVPPQINMTTKSTNRYVLENTKDSPS